MKNSDLYKIHHGGLIRASDLQAFAFSNGLQWSSVLVAVSRWQKQGLLERVTRGVYVVRDIEVHAPVAACTILPDSYISLESAMSHHGLLLDRTYRLDLACVRRVTGFRIRGVDVIIAKIPPRLYWGWEIEESLHGSVRIATPEKALFDRIYLDRTAEPGTTYFEDMGLLPDLLDLARFTELAKHSPKVKRFTRFLEEYCHD